MRKVVDVPRETIASNGLSGRARMVEGLSPVKGAMAQSAGNPYRAEKYGEIGPILPPPSSRTSPRRSLSDWIPSSPAASFKRGSHQAPVWISHRFIPQASLISMEAILPKKTEAKKEETRVMRDVRR